jgi:hypothetical protein
MNYISEIIRVKELMGLITESEMNGDDEIYYMKCEGGIGLIDPKSYELMTIKSDDGKDMIEFKKEPDPNFNNGDSKSIPTCLGFDIPLTGRCWSIGMSEGKKFAWFECDCKTGKQL